jgi:hypothetical protein
MTSAMLASIGARGTLGKDGGGQDRQVSDAVERDGRGGDLRGGVADASATHPPGASATLIVPLILLLLAPGTWGLTRLVRREPGAIPGRREWPPIEPPDQPPARGYE